MVDILKKLNAESGLTILLIEHVMRAVMSVATRVLVLHHGAAIRRGHPETVVREPRWCSPISGGGGVMLTVENLEVCPTATSARSTACRLKSRKGAIVAIVGANGAGKTTLIRTIAGMLRPAKGRIMLRDESIGGLESHRVCNLGIGQVAEGRQVFPTLTVWRI